MKPLLISLLAIIFLSSVGLADEDTKFTSLQLSLYYPAQWFPADTEVNGLRINLLYGVNDHVNGIDFGVFNRTNVRTNGVQMGAFPFGGLNMTSELNGFQFVGWYGGANIADNVEGIQFSGFFAGFNKANSLLGVQISGVFVGINIANNVQGTQLASLYNQATTMKGLQIGAVNICDQMHGVQIGLINIIKEGKMTVFPIANARF